MAPSKTLGWPSPPAPPEGLDSILGSEVTYWRLKGLACTRTDKWAEAIDALERAIALGVTDGYDRGLLEEAKKKVRE